MNRYYNPVRTLEGPGSLSSLPEILNGMEPDSKRILLLVWSEEVLKNPAFSFLLDQKSGFQTRPFCFQASNPTVEQLFETYEATKEFAPAVVIAVGGGSIMDVGKSLCCLYGHSLSNVDALRELIVTKAYGTPAARWIGIPTTAGTGSETTCWATIWDPSQDAKRSVECHENYAWAAVVDSDLTKGMPLKLAVSSGLDAAAHGVESYWAKGTNCVSRAMALSAIRMIMENMEGLLAGRETAREAMARGSMMAGLAFSNTKTTACHSISYPLTMHGGIPHGTAVSLLLAPVAEINEEAVEQKERLYKALGVSNVKELDARVKDILTRGGFPVTLSQWNIKREELRRLAELGITKGRADNNPVDLDPEKIQAILEKIYE